MICKFEEESLGAGCFLRRPAPAWGRGFRVTIRQTALLLAVGLAALGGSRLPAAATPQDTPAATSQDTAATKLPCLLAPDAPGVLVLFSGKAEELAQNFTHPDGTAPTWKVTDEGFLVAQDAGLMSKQVFGDCQLHVEFKIPQQEEAKEEQGSGIVLHGRFAMQIRDSSGSSQPGTNDCGAVFGLAAPRVNACKAPEEWQTYDIIFRAARFSKDGKTRLQAACVTAFLNGTLVQNNVEIPTRTGDLKIGPPDKPAPFLLQYRGCAMAFRNILALPLSQTAADAPAAAPGDANGQVVFNWKDAPKDEQIPVERVLFDQGGYQVQCGGGETLVVPFANDNLNTMKFGRSTTGSAYFVNDGSAPTLYLGNEGYLESAAAQDTRWFPFTSSYNYTSPVYVGLAPNWNGYSSMGWYNGMTVYGGVINTSRGAATIWMPGYHTVINDVPYNTYTAYRNYLTRNAKYNRNRVVYVNYAIRPTNSWTNRSGMSGQGRGAQLGQVGDGTHKVLPVLPNAPSASRPPFQPDVPRTMANPSRGTSTTGRNLSQPRNLTQPRSQSRAPSQPMYPGSNGRVINPPVNRPPVYNRPPMINQAPMRSPMVNRPPVMNRPPVYNRPPVVNPPRTVNPPRVVNPPAQNLPRRRR